MNYTEIFNALHPGFFNEKYISSLPPECEYTELVTDLREPPSGVQPVTFPPDITFGVYHGEITDLREAVREVDEGWLPYFTPNERFFCAYDGEKPVAFCILTDSGNIMGLHIGQPGCVGTIPAYRKKGIGHPACDRAPSSGKFRPLVDPLHPPRKLVSEARLPHRTALELHRHPERETVSHRGRSRPGKPLPPSPPGSSPLFLEHSAVI